MPRLEDLMVTGGFPAPLEKLFAQIDIHESFSAGAQKCAAFFRSVEEQFPAHELFAKLLEPTIPARWLEFALFCILDTGAPYLQIAEQALRLKCLRRLCMRKEACFTLSEKETAIADDLASQAGVCSVADLMSMAFSARTFVTNLANNQSINEDQRRLLAFLIRAEVSMLKERVRKISDEVDVYSFKEMARILPKVRTFDENAKDSLDLAEAIERGTPLSRRALTFEIALKIEPFDEWLAGLRKNDALKPIHELLIMQRGKLAATRSLVSLASLCRWIDEAEGREPGPVAWIGRALREYQGERFAVDSGRTAAKIHPLVDNGGAWFDGSIVTGDFSERLYSQWIDTDMLTRPLAESMETQRPAPSYREIIATHINNDRLIERLLDNEYVYAGFGLVEYIARVSRSVLVLSKIASRNYLYAGPANAVVPRALLENPSPIPMDLLRQFIKPSFFSPAELRALMKRDLRPDVLEEIRAYLVTSL